MLHTDEVRQWYSAIDSFGDEPAKSFDLRRGQVVELIVDEETPSSERCSVVWVGKAGSKQEGEVGLETVR